MTAEVESGTRARTRGAILAAAIEVWGKDPGAPLADIATAAQVGRTTLHRYFPERGDLATALGLEVVTRIDAASRRARLADGTGAEALGRLIQEYFELADVLAVMFNDSRLVGDDTWEAAGCTASDLVAVVERGHRDGSVHPGFTPPWVENVLWALLYATWQLVRAGGTTKPEAAALLTSSFEGAIQPRP